MRRSDAYKDRRRVSAGAIAVTALIASGLFSASLASIAIRQGQLVHESPWQLPFIICLIALALSCLSWLLTYTPSLVPSRLKLFDPTIQYSICLHDSFYRFSNMHKPGTFDGQIVAVFKNLGTSVVDVNESAWEFRRLSRLGERMESWKRSELDIRGIRLS